MTVGFSGNKIRIGGNTLNLVGGYNVTLTETGTTSVTLPTSGTIATVPNSCLQLVSTQAANNSASIVFSSIPNLSNFVLKFSNYQPATAQRLEMLLSTDNGSTFITTNYVSCGWVMNYNSSVYSVIAPVTTYLLVSSGSPASAPSNSGTCYIYNMNSTNNVSIRSQTFGNNITQSINTTMGYNTGVTAVNAFKLLAPSGNITSGSFSLYSLQS